MGHQRTTVTAKLPVTRWKNETPGAKSGMYVWNESETHPCKLTISYSVILTTSDSELLMKSVSVTKLSLKTAPLSLKTNSSTKNHNSHHWTSATNPVSVRS